MACPVLLQSIANWGKDIKTYAVTPLNEECGLIEWVDNLRTLRDLVIKLLRERGITPNVRQLAKAAFFALLCRLTRLSCSIMRLGIISMKHAPKYQMSLCSPRKYWQSEYYSLYLLSGWVMLIGFQVSSSPSWMVCWNVPWNRVMVCSKAKVYAVLRCHVDGWIRSRVCWNFYYLYLIFTFPGYWYFERLGDRHGENILFEEGTGGVLHVDFNCLFDKVRCKSDLRNESQLTAHRV